MACKRLFSHTARCYTYSNCTRSNSSNPSDFACEKTNQTICIVFFFFFRYFFLSPRVSRINALSIRTILDRYAFISPLTNRIKYQLIRSFETDANRKGFFFFLFFSVFFLHLSERQSALYALQ